MSADILIVQNIPSRKGYHYVLFVVDHGSKMSWGFPLTTHDPGSVLKFLTKCFREILASHNSDGGAELVSADVLSFLHTFLWCAYLSLSSRYPANAVTKRWVRSLKEKVLCMLLHFSLSVAFWWLGVDYAVYILNRISTKTAQVYDPI
jgi:hypothetical protein